MKTNLLFSTLVISTLAVNAQITITTADMAVAGGTYIRAHAPNVTSFGNAGANQTWNFAGWANSFTDTSNFVSPSAAAGFSNFPTSNLASTSSEGTIFFKNSSSSFDVLGFYGDFGFGPVALVFSPVQKNLTFPSTYLTTYNGVSKYSLKFNPNQPGIDSAQIKGSNNYTSTIDAWGSITTPANSNLNSLRQKYKDIRTDSTFVKPTGQAWTFAQVSGDTTYSYKWWTNTKKHPVAEILTDANNMVTNAYYLLSTPVGVNEQSMAKNNVNVFPNPASNNINITGISTESYLVIFDVNGKLMESSRLKKSNTSINTSGYENGIYFYQVVSMSGNTIGKGKFVVAK